MATAKRELTNPPVQGHRLIDLRDGKTPTESRLSRLLTIEQTAELLNVSVRNVREQIYRRRLAIVKVGRLVRIEQSELEAFIERGRSTSM
jgi:excisionase family DNA binding protein